MPWDQCRLWKEHFGVNGTRSGQQVDTAVMSTGLWPNIAVGTTGWKLAGTQSGSSFSKNTLLLTLCHLKHHGIFLLIASPMCFWTTEYCVLILTQRCHELQLARYIWWLSSAVRLRAGRHLLQNFSPQKSSDVSRYCVSFQQHKQQRRRAVCLITTSDSSVAQWYATAQRVCLFCCSGVFDFGRTISKWIPQITKHSRSWLSACWQIVGKTKISCFSVIQKQAMGILKVSI